MILALASMGCSASSAVSSSVDDAADSIACKHLNYKLGQKIGVGSFAQVHVATTTNKITSATSTTEVAVKIRHLYPEADMKSGDFGKVLKSSLHEVNLWKAVGAHRNCVRLLESCFDDHLAYMVMEKCDSTLFAHLRSVQDIDEAYLGMVFQQILSGIAHIHSVGVVHRDIKPDNFLVGGRKGKIVKICDFGLSDRMPTTGFLQGVVGTAPYMPPEMLATSWCNEKADIWSFGVVAHLLLIGSFPYNARDGSSRMMKKAILKGRPPNCCRDWLTSRAMSFLQLLLERDPEQRPTAIMAREFDFISKPVWDGLPCLEMVLKSASKTGAFNSQACSSATETDAVLEKIDKGELGNLYSKSFTHSNVTDAINRVATPSGKESPSIHSQSTTYESSPHSSELAVSFKSSSEATSPKWLPPSSSEFAFKQSGADKSLKWL